MKTQAGEGTFLGRFLYDKFGEPTQTFSLPVSSKHAQIRSTEFFLFFYFYLILFCGHQAPTDQSYDIVELQVLSNWGQKEYTCLYRFRVHGQTDVS